MNRTEQAGPVSTSAGQPGDRFTDRAPQRRAGGPAWAARTSGLCKNYGRTVALDAVDLDVPTGSVFGLLGPNGSGKTTLIRLMLGLARPSGGSVELLGRPMPAGAASALPFVGALVEGPGFQPFLTGRANLTRFAAAEPLLDTPAIPGAVDAALRLVGLTGDAATQAAADRGYRGYSLGMRQRLALATTMLIPRRLVVLDEPTNGLDPSGIRLVRRIIDGLRAAGTTVLVSSHALAEVEQSCTHVAVLSGGSVVATGELAALLEADGRTLSVSTAEPAAALTALRSARIPGYLEGGQVVVDLSGSSAERVVRVLVAAGVPVSEARGRRTALEELFVRLTEEGS